MQINAPHAAKGYLPPPKYIRRKIRICVVLYITWKLLKFVVFKAEGLPLFS
jgi:hypothetical protein